MPWLFGMAAPPEPAALLLTMQFWTVSSPPKLTIPPPSFWDELPLMASSVAPGPRRFRLLAMINSPLVSTRVEPVSSEIIQGAAGGGEVGNLPGIGPRGGAGG